MAIIKNIIETTFKTKGGKQAAKTTESIGRAQTRLGQASASSGRQFSAQASDLGVVVAAYAGAAATIFALTAAFSALNKAAAAQQAIEGTRVLAATVGESGDKILSKIKEITKGQLSIAKAAATANLALSAGFGSEQIEKLTTVALKASIALGRNLADSQDRLVRGVAKIEPEILDELGIIVRLDEAVRKYADSIGKAAADLTTYERSQAFANAVIDQGLKKFSIIDTSITTSAESLNKFSANLGDLSDALLGILAQAISPFIEFISGNFTNTLAAAGLLAGLIFSKLSQVVSAGLASATVSVTAFGARLAETFSIRATEASTALQTTLSKTLKGLNLSLIRGTRATQLAAKEIINLGRAGTLTAVDLRTLIKTLEAQGRAGVQVVTALKQANLAYKSLGKAAQIAATATAIATRIITGATRAVNLLVGAIGKIFFVISILQILASTIGKLVFGIDLFQAAGDTIKKFFENYTKEANAAARAQATFNKFLIKSSEAALKAQASLTKYFNAQQKFKVAQTIIGFKVSVKEFTGEDVLKETTERISKVREKLKRIVERSNALQGGKFTFDPKIFEGQLTSVLQAQGLGFKRSEILEAVKQQKTSFKLLSTATDSQLRQVYGEITASVIANAAKARFGLSDEMRNVLKIGLLDPALDAKGELQSAVKELFKVLEDAVPGLSGRFHAIADEIKNKKGVVEAFTISGVNEEALRDTGAKGKSMAGTEFGVEVLKTAPKLALLIAMTKEFQSTLVNTAFTSEGLSKKQDALRKTLTTTAEALKKLGTKDALGALKTMQELLGDDSLVQSASKIATNLATLGDSLKDLFGKEIKAAKDLYKVIRLDSEGVLHLNEDAVDVERSRLDYLKRGVELIAVRVDYEKKNKQTVAASYYLGKKTTELLELSAKEGEIANKTASILQGIYTKINLEIEKYTKQLDKANDKANLLLTTLTNQLSILEEQEKINANDIATKKDQAALSQKEALLQTKLKVGTDTGLHNSKLALDLDKSKLKLINAQVAQDIASMSRLKKSLEYSEQILIVAIKTAAEDERRANALKSSVASAFGNLFTEKDAQVIELEALRIDASEAERLLERQQKQFELDKRLANFKVDEQKKIFNQEQILINQRFKYEELKLKNEKTIINERIKILNDEKMRVGPDATSRIEQANLAKASKIATAEAAFVQRKIAKEFLDKQLDLMFEQAKALREHSTALGDVLFMHVKKIADTLGVKVKVSREEFGAQLGIEELGEKVMELKMNNILLLNTYESINTKLKEIANQEFENKKIQINAKKDENLAAIKNKLAILELEKLAFVERKGLLDEQKKIDETILQTKINAARHELSGVIDSSQQAVDAAKREVAAKNKAIESQEKLNSILNNEFLKIIDDIVGAIRNRLKQGAEDFFTAIEEGTLTMENFKKGVKDLFIGLLSDIGKSVFNRLVMEPLEQGIADIGKNLLGGILGDSFVKRDGTSAQKALFVQVVAGGAGGGQGLLQKALAPKQSANINDTLTASNDTLAISQNAVLASTNNATGGLNIFGSALESGSADLTLAGTQFTQGFEQIFSETGSFTAGLGNIFSGAFNGILGLGKNILGGLGSAIFGTGAAGTGLLSGIGGFFASMFGGGASDLPQGFASGGLVRRMAAGGLINQSNQRGIRHFASGGVQRDNIPAMLEPGEFIMRKQAVSKAGISAMQRMNGTGGSGQNISVNVSNEGAPKEADSSPDISITPEQIVVDVILRDLKNNGAIRRGIREQT